MDSVSAKMDTTRASYMKIGQRLAIVLLSDLVIRVATGGIVIHKHTDIALKHKWVIMPMRSWVPLNNYYARKEHIKMKSCNRLAKTVPRVPPQKKVEMVV
jgi:hypothetical protein